MTPGDARRGTGERRQDKDFVVKDSGHRQEWETGARRDTESGKGRYDLLPIRPLRRLAKHYEAGAIKYGPDNWQKGIPLMRYIDSAMRHLTQLVTREPTEDHGAAVAWNALSFMWTLERIEAGLLPKFLDDRPPPDIEFMTEVEFAAMRAEVAEVEKRHAEAARLAAFNLPPAKPVIEAESVAGVAQAPPFIRRNPFHGIEDERLDIEEEWRLLVAERKKEAEDAHATGAPHEHEPSSVEEADGMGHLYQRCACKATRRVLRNAEGPPLFGPWRPAGVCTVDTVLSSHEHLPVNSVKEFSTGSGVETIKEICHCGATRARIMYGPGHPKNGETGYTEWVAPR